MVLTSRMLCSWQQCPHPRSSGLSCDIWHSWWLCPSNNLLFLLVGHHHLFIPILPFWLFILRIFAGPPPLCKCRCSQAGPQHSPQSALLWLLPPPVCQCLTAKPSSLPHCNQEPQVYWIFHLNGSVLKTPPVQCPILSLTPSSFLNVPLQQGTEQSLQFANPSIGIHTWLFSLNRQSQNSLNPAS